MSSRDGVPTNLGAPSDATGFATWRGRRLMLAAGVAVAEALLVSVVFDLDRSEYVGFDWVGAVRHVVLFSICAVAAFMLVAAPRMGELVTLWTRAVDTRGMARPLGWNAVSMAALVAASLAISGRMPADGLPLAVVAGYVALLAFVAATLACLAAPIRFWPSAGRLFAFEILIAALIAIVAVVLAAAAQTGWRSMALTTLWLTHAILRIFATDTWIDPEQRILGLRNFEVHVDEACSGYEGIGLVATFLAAHCWLFRSSLRFPHAFLLLPAGILGVWLLNAFRIAALVGIGANVSPDVAIRGFHSQAGWIAVLVITLAVLHFAPRSRFFASAPQTRARCPDRAGGTAVAHLAPFMALMASGIVVAAAEPHGAWLYPITAITVGLCLWNSRADYRAMPRAIRSEPIAAGLMVGVAWLVTAPTPAGDVPLATWLSTQPATIVFGWLCLRALTGTLLVPIAEELAFRGYLHRWIISRDADSVPVGRFAWSAFLVTTIAFGVMHERWLAGMLAGAVFAILMYRSGRISAPIVAHMTANAVIIGWAITMGDWRHL